MFGVQIKMQRISTSVHSAVCVTPDRPVNPTPTRLLWEAFSRTAITARRLSVHIRLLLPITRNSFVQLCEPRQCGVVEIVLGTRGLEPTSYRSRLRRSARSDHCAAAPHKDECPPCASDNITRARLHTRQTSKPDHINEAICRFAIGRHR